jgi:hypothetical protein
MASSRDDTSMSVDPAIKWSSANGPSIIVLLLSPECLMRQA